MTIMTKMAVFAIVGDQTGVETWLLKGKVIKEEG